MKKLAIVLVVVIAVAIAWYIFGGTASPPPPSPVGGGKSIAAPGGVEVARVAEFEGSLSIERADGGKLEKVQRFGTSIRPNIVYNLDLVSTGADGKATLSLAFENDEGGDSMLHIAPSSSVRMDRQVLDSLKAKAEGKSKSRRIDVVGGSIDAVVNRNPDVLTEFKTPYGVAAVKGTRLTISLASDGSVDFKVTEGTLLVSNDIKGLGFVLQAGQSINALYDPITETVTFEVPATSTGTVRIITKQGMSVELKPGNKIVDTGRGGDFKMQVKAGDPVVMKTNTNEAFTVAKDAEVTVTTGTEGRVVVETEQGDVQYQSKDGVVRDLVQGESVTTEAKADTRGDPSPIKNQ